MLHTIWLIPLFPLLGSAVNGLWRRTLSETSVASIACGTVALSFLWSVLSFSALLSLPAESRAVEVVLYQWVSSADFQAAMGFLLDPLSAVMILVVSGVGLLIHIYSIGYMHGDEGFQRYFAYLNLFVCSMLLLVLGNNFLLMFLGWEGVGLCSYLLIGFWFTRQAAAEAGKKAFIVNRVGDVGFTLGVFLIFVTFDSIQFSDVFSRATQQLVPGGAVATAIALLLFLGATGKSAQIPLYVWLPDAMEGPTPVSALIHAATMVTAGVYMVARCSVLYLLAPAALTVVVIIGLMTALLAASLAMVQTDIKRVLAYSTISQLGYMFVACGVGAFSAGIFHLVTHACFKALLFLGAGSVIHALNGEQDIRRMGGLKDSLPITYTTFLIASLAIAGVFPFAGFFSKDEILWAALTEGHLLIWLIAAGVAVMTSFYMFRLVFLTFHGAPRPGAGVAAHPHEAPSPMRLPLVILAVLSAVAGFIGIPIIEGANLIRAYLEPVFTRYPLPSHALSHAIHRPGLELLMLLISLALAIAGILLAMYMYLIDTTLPQRLAARFQGAYRVLIGKYYVDELYDRLVVEPVKWTSDWLWARVDVGIVDGTIDRAGAFVRSDSAWLSRVQSGFVRNYALSIFLGAVVVIGYLIIR
ncbi:MAG TPA: NADH-quinone oxidoreductase subunit L [Candidatus Tectomicrobia bacterium]|nr:NADH-quinone oxidoreductase subunit L [Candidatus Tectomicrobia bacterium]